MVRGSACRAGSGRAQTGFAKLPNVQLDVATLDSDQRIAVDNCDWRRKEAGPMPGSCRTSPKYNVEVV